MVLLDFREISDQISLMRLDPLGLLQQLPSNEEYWEDENLGDILVTDIGWNEVVI